MTESTADVCAFVMEGAPLIYFGELFYDVADTAQEKPILKHALLKVIDPKNKKTNWVKVPCAGKESTVHLDPKVMRCVMVKNIDVDELNEYREASLRLYSKLHLA